MRAYELPTSLNINGVAYTIRTDFRAIIDILIAMNDPDLDQQAKTFIMTGINDKIKDKDFEEILPDLEKEAGEKIDLLFGAPVSESFFKITSPFTILDSGEMFAEQIIAVIGGIIEKELNAREKAEQERMKKYTEKYTG